MKTDIPPGADALFGGSSKICATCGNHCGHIGIYVGNGNIVHAWDGKIVNKTIDSVVNSGYPYRGWGWHGNQNFIPPTVTSPPAPTIPPSGISYIIKNVRSGKYLHVYGNGSANGTNVTVYAKDGTTGQTFRLIKTSNNWYTFTPACATGSRLNVYGYTAKNGSNVTIWVNTNSTTQGWYLESVSSGYIIRSANNRTYVLSAAGTTHSSNVQLATY